MDLKVRRLASVVAADLAEKMVFVAGPRQAGKTTLARMLTASRPHAYYTWDSQEHRRRLRAGQLDEAAEVWIFDEIHKFRRWRNWLKGVYDLQGSRHRIVVTGSGRLEWYGHGGDSLQGRFFLHHLHPFTLSEHLERPVVEAQQVPEIPNTEGAGARAALDDLLVLGGFPEPLLRGSERQARRWRAAYGSRLVRDDVRELENVRDLDRLELLHERLIDGIASVLSINSLREDLEVAFESVRNWISIFERLYVCFRLPPLGAPRIKAVRKEQKLYFWDWAQAAGEAARFENLVAMHLLRFCDWCLDVLGERIELRYFRTTVGHEVDFVILKDRKPWLAIETKMADEQLDRNLRYLLERVKIPYAFQVTLRGSKDYRVPDINGCRIRVLPATRFLCNLP